MRLYRPVGLKEWRLIEAADYLGFPPRLSWQPILYPVLEENYAVRIARDWNTSDSNSGFVGIVTTFELPDDFVAGYPERLVGDGECRELWIPAADLGLLNERLLGPIRVLQVFYGKDFEGPKLANLCGGG